MNPSIYKQFWRYTIPTLAAMLVNGLYQVVDGIFIGRYLGADGLAGINVAWPVISAVLGLGMLIGVGTGALVSLRQGEGQMAQAKSELTTGLSLLVIVTPLVALSLWRYNDTFLAWQGAQGGVFEMGKQYLDVLIVTCIFTLGSIAMPFLVRNDNSPNFATVMMIVGAVTNIVLDYVFIVLLDWQLIGAALATGIAQMVVMLGCVGYFFSPRAQLRLTLRHWQVDWRGIPRIFSIGTSSFFMYAYGSMMVGLHNYLFVEYDSALLIGAYTIIGYVVTVYYLAVEGVANGMQPLVSFNHGAKKPANILTLLNISLVTTITLGIVFVLLLNSFPQQVIAIFNHSDDELIRSTTHGIHLHVWALFLDGFIVIAGAYYQATNRGGKAMFVIVGNMLIQLPFLYVLPKWLGVDGIWLAYPLSNVTLALVVLAMLYADRKKIKAQLAAPATSNAYAQ
ncbi:putative efflux protein, MATE family [Vibrio xiamenensis]|uniref:Multidrug export protein MepA n=1 Tax=Vibrio xiamenensis TaxID=861298 RepID=A0A1G8B0P0_9VIBR|nr:MATE family efflux transporter [Vibrio xiamenensis]SDH26716.1 putative efflux protein, MATE family [Vibrio xiamenensis]